MQVQALYRMDFVCLNVSLPIFIIYLKEKEWGRGETLSPAHWFTTQLPPMASTNRKLASAAELAHEPMHADTGCKRPKSQLRPNIYSRMCFKKNLLIKILAKVHTDN